MMKRISLLLANAGALMLLTAGGLWASPLFTLQPPDLTGTAGETVGWGFAVTADPTYWISVTGSFLEAETNPGLGNYSDNIGALGGPIQFNLAPGAPDWVQIFDLGLGTGAGFYTIDPLAPIGAANIGRLTVLYEYFNGDPVLCGGSCLLGSGQMQADFSVEVVPVPEPSTAVLLPVAGLFLMWRGRRFPGSKR